MRVHCYSSEYVADSELIKIRIKIQFSWVMSLEMLDSLFSFWKQDYLILKMKHLKNDQVFKYKTNPCHKV